MKKFGDGTEICFSFIILRASVVNTKLLQSCNTFSFIGVKIFLKIFLIRILVIC